MERRPLILIVDDEPELLSLTSTALERRSPALLSANRCTDRR